MPDESGRIRPISVPAVPWHEAKKRAQLAEMKLEALNRRALDTPITEDSAELRGFILGITSHRRKDRP